MSAREDLELVTDFASLRTGMIVMLTPCIKCRRNCRSMLTRMEVGNYHEPGGPTKFGPKWFSLPNHIGINGRPTCITRDAVHERRLYRVVDPALASTQTTAARKRQPVRT